MRSGQVVVILFFGSLVIVFALGLYFWREQRHEDDRFSRIMNELADTYQQQIDSLKARVDQFVEHREQRADSLVLNPPAGTDYLQALRSHIDFLRGRLDYAASEAAKRVGADSIRFYIEMLADSQFCSTYGDYDQPHTWYFAPERLGQIGKAAIPPLMHRLDSTKGFEKQQVLYALLLAAQHDNVKVFTRGDYPDGRRVEYRGMDPAAAWKAWYFKYKQQW